MSKSRPISPFWRHARSVALAVYRARHGIPDGELTGVVPSRVLTREQQVREKYQVWQSPRLALAVAAEVRDLENRAFLDVVDSWSWLHCKLPNGDRNLDKYVEFRKGLSGYSLAWILGNLRHLRLDEFAAHQHREIDDAAHAAKRDQEIQDALWALQSPAKKPDPGPGDETDGHVRVYQLGEAPAARREDTGQKRFRETLSEPMPLRRAKDRHHLDEMISEAYAAAPWMREPLEWLWRHNIMLLNDPHPRIEIPPILLVGEPGTGKTYFARLLCEIMGLACARIDMSARSASFDITGIEHAWNSSTPGVPVRALVETKCANPVIILDEIEKAGKGTNGGSPIHALLPLLQRDTAREFICPSLQSEIDLSWCGWIATANDINLLPGPILDRVKAFRVEAPRGQDLRNLVERTLEPVRAEAEVVREVCKQIETGRMSLRGLRRLASEFRAISDRPLLN